MKSVLKLPLCALCVLVFVLSSGCSGHGTMSPRDGELHVAAATARDRSRARDRRGARAELQQQQLQHLPSLDDVGQAIDDDGIHRKYACEGNTLSIVCARDRRIRINSAMFGRTSWEADICLDRHVTNRPTDLRLPCTSTKALQTVNDKCNGKRTCTLLSSPNTFRTPGLCPGLHSYLDVRFFCESTVAPTLPPARPTLLQTLLPPPPPPPAPLMTSRAPGPPGYWPTTTVRHSGGGPRTRCPAVNERNMSWPETEAGQLATVPCPGGSNGNVVLHPDEGQGQIQGIATWYCGERPVRWVGKPNLKLCISSGVSDMRTLLRQSNKDFFAPDLMETVTAEVLKVSTRTGRMYGGDLDAVTDVMDDVVNRLATQIQDDSFDISLSPLVHKVFETVVTTSDVLLGAHHVDTWNDLGRSDRAKAASRMLQTIESSSLQFASTLPVDGSGKPVTNITDNIVLEVGIISDDPSASLEFPRQGSLFGTQWEKLRNSIRLPGRAVSHLGQLGRMKFAFLMYSNLEKWMVPTTATRSTNEAGTRTLNVNEENEDNCESTVNDENTNNNCSNAIINSNIISVAVSSRLVHSIKLREPVTFTLEHKQVHNVSNASCVFWKHLDSTTGGEWSKDGCMLISSNKTHTSCSCDHLTSFAIIMSPTAPQLSEGNELALTIITYIGCMLSLVCLALAFLTFQFCRTIQGDRNTVHKNLVINLFVANIIFLAGIEQYSIPTLCSVVAGFLHYFFLTSFAWMCLEGIQLYMMLVEVFEAEKSRVVWYYLAAYGIPAIVVGISAAVYHDGYGTPYHCWLSVERGFIWSFIGPVIAIMLVNSAMLGIAISAMCQHAKMATLWRKDKPTKLQQFKSWVKGAFLLEILLGLTWAFGLAFVNEQTVAFAYIFTILNSLQGTFIFVFHCLMNDKVRTEYQRMIRRMTCLPESFRRKFGGGRLSMSTVHNHSNSSGGNYFTRLLSGRRRRSSSSTTLSKSNSLSNRRSAVNKDQPPEESPLNNPAVSIHVTDSGIDDPSSYMEPAGIRLGESEFQLTDNDISQMEGSVADTDYTDRMVQRHSVKTTGVEPPATTNQRDKNLSHQPDNNNRAHESGRSKRSRQKPAASSFVPEDISEHSEQLEEDSGIMNHSSEERVSSPDENNSSVGDADHLVRHKKSRTKPVSRLASIPDERSCNPLLEDSGVLSKCSEERTSLVGGASESDRELLPTTTRPKSTRSASRPSSLPVGSDSKSQRTPLEDSGVMSQGIEEAEEQVPSSSEKHGTNKESRHSAKSKRLRPRASPPPPPIEDNDELPYQIGSSCSSSGKDVQQNSRTEGERISPTLTDDYCDDSHLFSKVTSC